MASDATMPETEPISTPEDDGSVMPSDSRQRGRRRRQRISLFAMISAELSAMLFMLALGLWVALILLSSFFPFSSLIDDMGLKGVSVTALAAAVVALLTPSVFRFWTEGDRAGAIMAAGLALVMIGNWLGWFYHFNLPSEVMQFLG
ncbi:MAG TPA: hypothetical protein VJ843_01250 [Candidatus Saccharimonadales bacterium]|nr:hypothetical protein [Candidatus Saccharimonadales bacterium]